MNDKARTIRMQHCAAIRRTLQRILDNPAAGFETWFSKTALAVLPPPSRMTDRELSMARHTLAQSRTRFMEEASMPTRQPAPEVTDIIASKDKEIAYWSERVRVLLAEKRAAPVASAPVVAVPVAYVPVHPRTSEVLWANTIPTLDLPHPSYEMRPLVFAPQPAATPVAAAVQGALDAEFAAFCDREGYPSDGPFDAVLRKAFTAGHAAPADAAPVDAKPIPRAPSYRFPIGEDGDYEVRDNNGRKVGELYFYVDALNIQQALSKAAQPSAAQGDVLSQQVGSIPTWHDRLEASGPAKPAHDDLIRSRDAEIGELRRALSQRAASQDSEHDAARYRFMFRNSNNIKFPLFWTRDSLNQAIDAAMAAQQGVKGGTA